MSEAEGHREGQAVHGGLQRLGPEKRSRIALSRARQQRKLEILAQNLEDAMADLAGLARLLRQAQETLQEYEKASKDTEALWDDSWP